MRLNVKGTSNTLFKLNFLKIYFNVYLFNVILMFYFVNFNEKKRSFIGIY